MSNPKNDLSQLAENYKATGLSPIHIAIKQHFFKTSAGEINWYDLSTIKQTLLETPDDINKKDSNGNTPLHYSLIYPNLFVWDFLDFNGADMKIENNIGKSPEDMYMHIKKDASLWNNFINFTPDYALRVKTLPRETVLHMAVKREDLPAIDNISSVCPWLIDEKDRDGNTPLHLAARSQNLDCVIILFKHNADTRIKNKQGLLFFDIIPLQMLENLLCLMSKNECIQDKIIPFTDGTEHLNNDLTLFHKAISNDNDRVLQLLCDFFPQLINIKDRDGNTLLHWGARRPKLDCVKVLIRNNANLTIKNRQGSLPLDIMSLQRLEELFYLFPGNECIQDKIRPYATGIKRLQNGFTLFHKTIFDNNWLGLQCLCVTFPDFIDKRDSYGNTLLHLARLLRKPPCESILLEHGAIQDNGGDDFIQLVLHYGQSVLKNFTNSYEVPLRYINDAFERLIFELKAKKFTDDHNIRCGQLRDAIKAVNSMLMSGNKSQSKDIDELSSKWKFLNKVILEFSIQKQKQNAEAERKANEELKKSVEKELMELCDKHLQTQYGKGVNYQNVLLKDPIQLSVILDRCKQLLLHNAGEKEQELIKEDVAKKQKEIDEKVKTWQQPEPNSAYVANVLQAMQDRLYESLGEEYRHPILDKGKFVLPDEFKENFYGVLPYFRQNLEKCSRDGVEIKIGEALCKTGINGIAVYGDGSSRCIILPATAVNRGDFRDIEGLFDKSTDPTYTYFALNKSKHLTIDEIVELYKAGHVKRDIVVELYETGLINFNISEVLKLYKDYAADQRSRFSQGLMEILMGEELVMYNFSERRPFNEITKKEQEAAVRGLKNFLKEYVLAVNIDFDESGKRFIVGNRGGVFKKEDGSVGLRTPGRPEVKIGLSNGEFVDHSTIVFSNAAHMKSFIDAVYSPENIELFTENLVTMFASDVTKPVRKDSELRRSMPNLPWQGDARFYNPRPDSSVTITMPDTSPNRPTKNTKGKRKGK